MTSAKLRFQSRPSKSSRVIAVAQRVIVITALLHVVIGAWSAYRAWVQVREVDIRLVSANISAGMPVIVNAVSSGRVPINVRLELVQGTHAELLANMRISASRDGFYDPRFRRGMMAPTLTPEFLAHFQAGPAILRATGNGGPQWFRTPPPVVREEPVVIGP